MNAPEVVSLDDATYYAQQARDEAGALRDRLEAGEDVSAAELAQVEQAEAHAARRLEAARRRDVEERKQRTAEGIAAARADVQAEWAEHQRGEPAKLVEAREQAVVAATNYLALYREHSDYVSRLHERAHALGFAVSRAKTTRSSPLPGLSKAIMARAREHLERRWRQPRLDEPEAIWGKA